MTQPVRETSEDILRGMQSAATVPESLAVNTVSQPQCCPTAPAPTASAMPHLPVAEREHDKLTAMSPRGDLQVPEPAGGDISRRLGREKLMRGTLPFFLYRGH